MRALIPLAIVAGVLFSIPMLLIWDRPPIDVQQIGFRGTAMEEVDNPRIAEELRERNQPPEVIFAGGVEPFGDLAGDVYENVQVLGDLTEDEFNNLMLSITQWVSPEQGCAYCHNEENLASDEVYTKIVARSMLEMTRVINAEWASHVAGVTGEDGAYVNCYTCHRGNNVPEYVWYNADGIEGQAQAAGMLGSRDDQNLADAETAFSSLPYTALETKLNGDEAIRVIADNELPRVGVDGASIQATEATYSLMMHMSDSLGVNCTYCHNSRAFSMWDQGPATRTTAWYGIRMVRQINQAYLEPLTPVFPDNRLGPQGDVAKVNCETCHQGVNLPMYGAFMLEEHPTLGVWPED